MLLRLVFSKQMGRPALTKALSLGEATVKTMIKNLGTEGIMESSSRGQVLTVKGADIAKRIEERISHPVNVKVPEISGKSSVAFIVRGAREKIRKGIEQRDEGIKHNVDVTTLVFEEGKIRFPGTRNVAGIRELEGALAEGDAILISSGKNIGEAKKGGFAVALAII
jgi:hypothetical protein